MTNPDHSERVFRCPECGDEITVPESYFSTLDSGLTPSCAHGDRLPPMVEVKPECCHGVDDVCVSSGCLMGIPGAENG